MKNKILKLLLSTTSISTAITPFSLTSCSNHHSYKVDAPVDKGEKIKTSEYKKVFILLGQSNAVGFSSNSYLEKYVTPAEYQTYKSGFNKVQISYWNSWDLPTETQTFKATDFYCGANNTYFGIELGFADIMNKYSDDNIYLIKYAVSGSNLNFQWLNAFGKRGTLYNNSIKFIKNQMDLIPNSKICGVCWMQGESDAAPVINLRYLHNTKKFVSYLREDLKEYTIPSGFTFVDAGIADNWKKYDAINYAKIQYSKSSALNGYFSTTENGLTNDTEPEGNPDRAHYDSYSELQLGRWFALKTIELYNKNN